MTDNRLRILADGLFDGGLAADVAPPDLRAAVNVLSAAGRPGSDAELALMAARVRQFSVEVNAAAPLSIVHAPVCAAAFTNPALSNDTPRSNPMFSTRVTRKALSIFAITLLAAGTAAAAAGGALPMFEEESNEVVVDNGNDDDTNVVEDDTHKSDDDQPGANADDESPKSIPEARVENHNGDVDHHGKCTAWTNGSAKSATSPAFAELQTAADGAAVSIDEYCATVLGTTDDKGESDNDESDNDESDNDESDNDESDNDESDNDESGGSGNSGNGNSGNGNSGNGAGNSGSDDSGIGNSEIGNSGKGRGNSQG